VRPAAKRQGRPRRRYWRQVALIAAALFACELMLAAGGRVELVPERAGPGGSPAGAARACSGHQPRQDRQLLHACVRVTGRVLYVRAERLSGGRIETHLLVVASMHLLVVKPVAGLRLPSVGARIDAVGPMVRARNGLREVEALVL